MTIALDAVLASHSARGDSYYAVEPGDVDPEEPMMWFERPMTVPIPELEAALDRMRAQDPTEHAGPRRGGDAACSHASASHTCGPSIF